MEVEIFEQPVIKDGVIIGIIAIFRGGLVTDNPTRILNEAIDNWLDGRAHNQFIEISLCNPWVRIVTIGINDFDYKPI